MKQKFFVLSAIALMTVVGLFVFEHVTSAQRPDRNTQPGQDQRGDRSGSDRRDRSIMDMFNPVFIVEDSWIDLSFKVGVDDETLVKARPIYQATHKDFSVKMQEIRAKYGDKMREAFSSDDRRAAMQKIQEGIREETSALVISGGKEFQTSLKEVLSEEQMKKLNTLTKERQTAEKQRRNRFSGEGGQRRGQGGQRPNR